MSSDQYSKKVPLLWAAWPWFALCFLVGLVLSAYLLVEGHFRDAVVIAVWAAGALWFTVAGWRGVRSVDVTGQANASDEAGWDPWTEEE